MTPRLPGACRRWRCSRTPWRSNLTTTPPSASAEHARSTLHHSRPAAAGAYRAPVPHMHPCSHAARERFPRPRPDRACAPRKLICDRSEHERGLEGMLHLGSLPLSLRRRRVYYDEYKPCSSASTVCGRSWTVTMPHASIERVAIALHRFAKAPLQRPRP
eukprot:6345747-Prymnesium_polylepis.1